MPKTMTLSEAHLAAFARQQRERFEEELAAYLRREYPAETDRLGEPGLRKLIDDGTQAAAGYGIVREPDVARYVELMLTISPDFDRSRQMPWAGPILTDPRMTGTRKISAIYEHLVFGTADLRDRRLVR